MKLIGDSACSITTFVFPENDSNQWQQLLIAMFVDRWLRLLPGIKKPNGSLTRLRYMVFKPKANKIGIYTYNPALDKFRNGPSSRFDLDYPMTLPLDAVPGIARPGAANDVNEAAEQSSTGE